MKKRVLTLAFAASLGLAGLTFTSCNDEEDLVRTRPIKDERVIDYSRFEDNGFSDSEVIRMTSDFSTHFADNTVSNMSIEEAVIIAETYWNYGIVAVQETTSGNPYEEINFTFNAAINSDDSVSGESFASNFKDILLSVHEQMNGKVINIADVSVIAYENSYVTFNIKVLPFDGDLGLSRASVKVLKQYGDPINVPDDYKIEIQSLISSISSPCKTKEIPGLFKLMQKVLPYYAIQIKSEIGPINDISIDHCYMTRLGANPEDLLYSGPVNIYHNETHPTVFATDVKNIIIPSYLKNIKRTWAEDRDVISFQPVLEKDWYQHYKSYYHEMFGIDQPFYSEPSLEEMLSFALYRAANYYFARLKPYDELHQTDINDITKFSDILTLWQAPIN